MTSLGLILFAGMLQAEGPLPSELPPEVRPHQERSTVTTQPAKTAAGPQAEQKRTKNPRIPSTRPALEVRSGQAKGPPHFLALESSRECLQQICHGAAGSATRPGSPKSGLKSIEANLRKIADGSDVRIERDEARLLLAIAATKAGRMKEAANGFAELVEAETAAVAEAARRYAYLVKACPGGILDGFSIARHETYLAACSVFADVEARRGKALAGKAASASVMTLALWRSAWEMQEQAFEAYSIAAMLDQRFAPSAEDKAALAKTKQRLATSGVSLLALEVERQKAALMNVIKRLRTAGRGEWGPPSVAKRADAMIAAVQETKRQMQEVMAAAFGRAWTRQAAHAALAHTIEEADCLKVSRTGDNARLRDHLAKLFREVSSRPARRTDHLFRLRYIANHASRSKAGRRFE